MTTLNSRFLMITSILMVMPLYVVLTPSGFAFAPFLVFDSEITQISAGITLGLIGVFFLVMISLIQAKTIIRRLSKSENNLAIIFITWSILIVLINLKESKNLAGVAILIIQTMIPIFLYFCALLLPIKKRNVECILIAIPFVSAASIIILSIFGLYNIQKSNSNFEAWLFIQEGFYGAKNIQPVIVTIGLALTLAAFSSRRVSRFWLWGLFLVHSGYLLLIWSRTGVLIIGLTFGFWILSEFWKKSVSWRTLALMVVTMSFMAIATLTVAGLSLRLNKAIIPLGESSESTEQIISENKEPVISENKEPVISENKEPVISDNKQQVIDENKKQGIDDNKKQIIGDNRRKLLLDGGIQEIAQNPFIGHAFEPIPQGTVVGGIPVTSKYKSYPAHNLFIDMAIRTGLPGAILYFLFLGKIGINLWNNKSEEYLGQAAKVSVFILVSLLISCFWQNYFIVTQSGSIAFLLFGFASRKRDSFVS